MNNNRQLITQYHYLFDKNLVKIQMQHGKTLLRHMIQ